ncbi:MAG: hypothetical protein KF901_10750 [Myxococcales bacterium]|nr:hypothetical protein [Myxococcales bacterium]
MLQPVEILVQRRRSSRHAVDLACEVVAEPWDVPIRHRLRELGPGSLFVESDLLPEEGAEVLVELIPPRAARPLTLLGTVRRSILRRRRQERRRSGFAVELDAAQWRELEALRESVRGLPPAIPRGPRTVERDFVWVDELVELGGEGVAIFSEAALDEAFACARSGDFLTVGTRPFFP